MPAFFRGPQQAPLLRLVGRKARAATRNPGSPAIPGFGLMGWEESLPRPCCFKIVIPSAVARDLLCSASMSKTPAYSGRWVTLHLCVDPRSQCLSFRSCAQSRTPLIQNCRVRYWRSALAESLGIYAASSCCVLRLVQLKHCWRKVAHSRSVQHLSIRIEPRAVARAVPALLR